MSPSILFLDRHRRRGTREKISPGDADAEGRTQRGPLDGAILFGATRLQRPAKPLNGVHTCRGYDTVPQGKGGDVTSCFLGS